MKTFRMIGMALFAVLMCVNFASCSSDDDDDSTEEKEEGGVVVSGKKITKIVGQTEGGSYLETYTFSYDNKGRLVKAVEKEQEDNYTSTDTFDFIWGDDAIKVTEKSTYSGSSSTYTESYTLILNNGLVQYEDYGDDDGVGTYTYNSSNRLIKFSDGGSWAETAIWDGDKLVSKTDGSEEGKLSYGKSCKKGYFPLIASIMEAGECNILYMAHPEIAGMRTTQCPTSITWTDTDDYSGGTDSETKNITYEFDKDGYISKITIKTTYKDDSTDTATLTLTWE
ncbi:MAG: DUF4595 domain-containing protein [Bacteroidaceae bacterium]|nr:DUF4595 domain-containing protein [Bacteroidaceae bacterium]